MATKKEIRLYGDLVNHHRLSFKTIFLQLLLGYFNKKRGVKETMYQSGAAFPPPVDHLRELPLKYLAVVNNKTVLELIRLDERTAEHIQKRGSKLVPFEPTEQIVKKGMKYIDSKFVEEDSVEINEAD